MKKQIHIALSVLFLFSNALYFVGCSGKQVDENNPQAVYEDAEEDVKDKRYAMALEKMKNLKNKHPYSHYAVLAQLRVADINFLDEAYIEAAASYELFRDLHPKHEKSDYVVFQIGESYFNQLPSTIDRDLTPGTKAIEAYRDLMTSYPKSEYIEKTKAHLDEANQKLATKENYIADFYYKREMYDSAAKRYEKIATKYVGTTVEENAYYRWGESLMLQSADPAFAEEKGTIQGEAKHVFKTYLSRYPEGKYASKANTSLAKLSQ